MPHDVFVSYSSKDKATADAACARLEAEGVRCWIAPRDILPSADWSEAIVDAIGASRVMVLIFSGHANASEQVKREVELAVDRGLAVLPFRIEAVEPAKAMEYFLGTPHWLDALTRPMEQHLARLAEAVKVVLGGRRTEPAAAGRPPRPPPQATAPRRRVLRAAVALAAVAAMAVAAALALRHLTRPEPEPGADSRTAAGADAGPPAAASASATRTTAAGATAMPSSSSSPADLPAFYAVSAVGPHAGGAGVSRATAVSNNGHVVGASGQTLTGSDEHAFLYHGGRFIDLGTLGGATSRAYGVNDGGQVVGEADTAEPGVAHAFLYAGGKMMDLGPAGSRSSRARGINAAGQIVGSVGSDRSERPGDAPERAFLYSNGKMIELGTSDGRASSVAVAVDGEGRVVGWQWSGAGFGSPFLLSDGKWNHLGFTAPARCMGLNDRGQVVGMTLDDHFMAFRWSRGRRVDLGTLGGDGSVATGINGHGHVVGNSHVKPGSGATHAFAHDRTGLHDLNSRIPADSGWLLEKATGINDAGQIVGTGYFKGDGPRAFLLTPAAEDQ